MPDDALCPQCRKVRPAWDGLLAALQERNLTLEMAQPAICECARLAEERQHQRRVAANVPISDMPRTLDNFNLVPGAEEAMDAVRAFIAGEGAAVLTLVGGTGSGKSHLLEAAGRILVDQGERCRFEESAMMLQNMRPPSDGQETDRDWFAYYQAIPVLLIDDLGVEKPSVWAIERLTAILNPRLRDHRRTLITTNLSRSRMQSHLSREDPVGARRLVSRLFGENTGEAKVCMLTCPDYRTGRAW